MGCVYLLGDTDKEGYYKVGVTTGDVYKRIKKLQTGNSGEIYLINKYDTPHPFFIEARMHAKFHKGKILNEWFQLSDEDLKNFIKYCQDIDKMIDSMKDNPFFPKKLK